MNSQLEHDLLSSDEEYSSDEGTEEDDKDFTEMFQSILDQTMSCDDDDEDLVDLQDLLHSFDNVIDDMDMPEVKRQRARRRVRKTMKGIASDELAKSGGRRVQISKRKVKSELESILSTALKAGIEVVGNVLADAAKNAIAGVMEGFFGGF